IGFGHTGSRFCELLQGLSVKILVYDKYKQLSNQAGRYTVVNAVSEIQQSADVISLHLPLTPETNGLINGDFIAGCRKSIYLINTSRGKIVETRALLDGLRGGKLKGACLDVFENEKPATFSPDEEELYAALYRMEQVVLSPHIAGWTHQSKQKIAEVILEKLDRIEDLV
ncbi:MAG TPA: NAD(P)-dependent oxidoreductase, partial [Saprospiraceae bacterium]|nr:NAD(P)-dependent oxidoreductase [Saprospiraceae bacterium]